MQLLRHRASEARTRRFARVNEDGANIVFPSFGQVTFEAVRIFGSGDLPNDAHKNSLRSRRRFEQICDRVLTLRISIASDGHKHFRTIVIVVVGRDVVGRAAWIEQHGINSRISVVHAALTGKRSRRPAPKRRAWRRFGCRGRRRFEPEKRASYRRSSGRS